MKEAVISITESLKKGLALANNTRNSSALTQSLGAIPFNGALVSVQQFAKINTEALGELSFPYPQLFVLSEATIVCTPSAIYEYDGAVLTEKLSGITVGSTWVAVDYKKYVYLSNGKVAVIRSNNIYSISSDLPASNAACDFNGQAVIDGSGL